MAKKKSKAKAKTKTKKKVKAKAKTKAQAKRRPAAKTRRRAAKPNAGRKKTAKARAAKPRANLPVVPSIAVLPDIDVETTGGGRFRLSSLKGNNVVLYFYPKDDTPGCTAEGCEIRDHYAEFQRLDAVVYGVSRDGLDAHARFKAKFGFPFELIADPDETLCRAFGVMQQKSLYGRTYMGVDRSTFIFDKAGMLRKELRNVKVPGHVDQVLEEVGKL